MISDILQDGVEIITEFIKWFLGPRRASTYAESGATLAA